ncbi:hypothetical protein [Weeksella virosa]|uniref:hypothetical protein n=1 Tax=Weeksella virosa TaxID=1014 RepID=UPI002554E387|nr:hypothetical protein [Weeksella virosa]
MKKTTQEMMLINTISDCILINNLGIAIDKTLFTAFENLCYLLGVDYYEIDPDLYRELDELLKSVHLIDKSSYTEIIEDLEIESKKLLPQLEEAIKKYY